MNKMEILLQFHLAVKRPLLILPKAIYLPSKKKKKKLKLQKTKLNQTYISFAKFELLFCILRRGWEHAPFLNLPVRLSSSFLLSTFSCGF